MKQIIAALALTAALAACSGPDTCQSLKYKHEKLKLSAYNFADSHSEYVEYAEEANAVRTEIQTMGCGRLGIHVRELRIR